MPGRGKIEYPAQKEARIMTMGRPPFELASGLLPNLAGVGGNQEKMARSLFAAIMAAGKSTCDCQVCQLMKKVSDAMVSDLLKEESGATD